jgi:hypothetical protein
MGRNKTKHKGKREHAEGGAYFSFELADVKLLFNALKQYKPTEEEKVLHDIWLESFDETIYVEEGSSEGFPRD